MQQKNKINFRRFYSIVLLVIMISSVAADHQTGPQGKEYIDLSDAEKQQFLEHQLGIIAPKAATISYDPVTKTIIVASNGIIKCTKTTSSDVHIQLEKDAIADVREFAQGTLQLSQAAAKVVAKNGEFVITRGSRVTVESGNIEFEDLDLAESHLRLPNSQGGEESYTISGEAVSLTTEILKTNKFVSVGEYTFYATQTKLPEKRDGKIVTGGDGFQLLIKGADFFNVNPNAVNLRIKNVVLITKNGKEKGSVQGSAEIQGNLILLRPVSAFYSKDIAVETIAGITISPDCGFTSLGCIETTENLRIISPYAKDALTVRAADGRFNNIIVSGVAQPDEQLRPQIDLRIEKDGQDASFVFLGDMKPLALGEILGLQSNIVQVDKNKVFVVSFNNQLHLNDPNMVSNNPVQILSVVKTAEEKESLLGLFAQADALQPFDYLHLLQTEQDPVIKKRIAAFFDELTIESKQENQITKQLLDQLHQLSAEDKKIIQENLGNQLILLAVADTAEQKEVIINNNQIATADDLVTALTFLEDAPQLQKELLDKLPQITQQQPLQPTILPELLASLKDTELQRSLVAKLGKSIFEDRIIYDSLQQITDKKLAQELIKRIHQKIGDFGEATAYYEITFGKDPQKIKKAVEAMIEKTKESSFHQSSFHQSRIDIFRELKEYPDLQEKILASSPGNIEWDNDLRDILQNAAPQLIPTIIQKVDPAIRAVYSSDYQFKKDALTTIYASADFQQLTQQITEAPTSYSIAVATMRLLDREQKQLTPENIKQAAQTIITARKTAADIHLLDAETTFIPVTNDEKYADGSDRFGEEPLVELALQSGVKPENIVHGVHGSEKKEQLLETVAQSTGKTTLYFNNHGGQEGQFLSGGKEVTYKELGNAILARERAGQTTGDLRIMFDSCYSYDYAVNLYDYLQKNNAKTLPVIVTETNRGQIGYGFAQQAQTALNTKKDSPFAYHLDRVRQPGTPLTIGHVFAAEPGFFGGVGSEDSAQFIPTSQQQVIDLGSDKDDRGIMRLEEKERQQKKPTFIEVGDANAETQQIIG